MTDKQTDVETIKQWGIKAISSRVSDEISEAAPKLGLTNGQLIEKMWEAWKAGGQPMALPAQSHPDLAASGHTNVGDLVQLVEAARSLKELPPDIETVARVGIKAGIRQARGLPPLKPRQQRKPPAARSLTAPTPT